MRTGDCERELHSLLKEDVRSPFTLSPCLLELIASTATGRSVSVDLREQTRRGRVDDGARTARGTSRLSLPLSSSRSNLQLNALISLGFGLTENNDAPLAHPPLQRRHRHQRPRRAGLGSQERSG